MGSAAPGGVGVTFLADIIASRYGSGLTQSCLVSHRVSGREVRSMSDLIPAPSADR
jgi:hypothetical protein